jgi:misacylated tRNA(Ala) deacylase
MSAEERGIVPDRAVFYPLGAGQPGDIGSLKIEDGREVAIVDARKGEAGERSCTSRRRGTPD